MGNNSGISPRVALWINKTVLKNCLLGISPASEHYKPTFRNSVSVPSSAGAEDGTDTEFRNVGL